MGMSKVCRGFTLPVQRPDGTTFNMICAVDSDAELPSGFLQLMAGHMLTMPIPKKGPCIRTFEHHNESAHLYVILKNENTLFITHSKTFFKQSVAAEKSAWRRRQN